MNKVNTDEKAINYIFDRYVEMVFPSKEKSLEIMKSGQKLTFYLGIDPTGPDIHLGHSTNLLVLKKLIELGHKVILLIGDFTASIGDPTGKDTSRKPLNDEEIKVNMKTYIQQACKILPKGSFEIRYNSKWLSKMTFKDLVKLASGFTVQQMIVREMFQKRLKDDKPIGIHEFLYPLAQGYDSVAMKVDGEIGGNDQMFNMLVGRDLSKTLLNKEKIVITTKLLEDPATGKKIMSKSEGRYISLNDEPQEIRRKILELNDSMTKVVFDLCTEKDQAVVDKKSKETDPRQFKEELAKELVLMYHGKKAVDEIDKPNPSFGSSESLSKFVAENLNISMSRSKELINQGAVDVNDTTIKDWNYEVKIGEIVRVGKGRKIIKI